MKKKIIAISSTHGCGKSTLAYEVCTKMKKAGHNVLVLDELARKCPFDINQTAGDKTGVWLACKQITEELELTETCDYVIVDRSLLDSYCYDTALNASSGYVDHLIPIIGAHIKKYYYRIYVPHKDTFNYCVADGVRDLDPKFRDKVFNTILKMYKKFGIEHKIVYTPEEVFQDLKI